MTARSRLHPRRLVSAGALAALAAALVFPGAAHALDAPAPPPDETETTVAPEDVSTTTTTVAPVATSDPAATPPAENPAEDAGPAVAAAADARAAAVSGPPTVNATPTTGLNPAGGSTVGVTGSGFDPNANNAFGVYVVFGPVDPGTYFKDANRFLAAMWIHTGGGASGSPGQGDLRADGTFSTTLPPTGGGALTATYTDGNGTAVNCLVTQCYVVTMAAHGVSDRSMDTCTPVSFAGGTATANVDRSCQPVATPAGQPTGAGTPTGTNGSGGNGGSTGGGAGDGASSTLPRTGSAGPWLALAGVVALVSGLVLAQRDRQRRTKSRPVAVGRPTGAGHDHLGRPPGGVRPVVTGLTRPAGIPRPRGSSDPSAS